MDHGQAGSAHADFVIHLISKVLSARLLKFECTSWHKSTPPISSSLVSVSTNVSLAARVRVVAYYTKVLDLAGNCIAFVERRRG